MHIIQSKLDQLTQLGAVAFKGGGGSSGGAAGSGKVGYSSYLENIHEDFLRNGQDNPTHLNPHISMNDAVNTAWDNSPYTDIFAFDPTGWLEATQTRYDSFNIALQAINPATDYATFMGTSRTQSGTSLDAAVSSAITDYAPLITSAITQSTTMISDATVNAAVTAFENRQSAARARAKARNNAGFADINAVHGSAYIIADALIENDGLGELAKFNADMQMQAYRDRNTMVAAMTADLLRLVGLKLTVEQAATGDILRYSMFKTEADRASATLQGEMNRLRIVAMREFVDDDAEFQVKDRTWNIGLFQDAGNLLAAVHGGVAQANKDQRKATSGVSMLGGAISGAASGAMIGSAVPGWGTAIGAIVGGGLGMLGS